MNGDGEGSPTAFVSEAIEKKKFCRKWKNRHEGGHLGRHLRPFATLVTILNLNSKL
jgi:hypothetical protein